jgi:hypothetical protein
MYFIFYGIPVLGILSCLDWYEGSIVVGQCVIGGHVFTSYDVYYGFLFYGFVLGGVFLPFIIVELVLMLGDVILWILQYMKRKRQKNKK